MKTKEEITRISIDNIWTAMKLNVMSISEAKLRFVSLNEGKTKEEINELFYEFLTKDRGNGKD